MKPTQQNIGPVGSAYPFPLPSRCFLLPFAVLPAQLASQGEYNRLLLLEQMATGGEEAPSLRSNLPLAAACGS